MIKQEQNSIVKKESLKLPLYCQKVCVYTCVCVYVCMFFLCFCVVDTNIENEVTIKTSIKHK